MKLTPRAFFRCTSRWAAVLITFLNCSLRDFLHRICNFFGKSSARMFSATIFLLCVSYKMVCLPWDKLANYETSKQVLYAKQCLLLKSNNKNIKLSKVFNINHLFVPLIGSTPRFKPISSLHPHIQLSFLFLNQFRICSRIKISFHFSELLQFLAWLPHTYTTQSLQLSLKIALKPHLMPFR